MSKHSLFAPLRVLAAFASLAVATVAAGQVVPNRIQNLPSPPVVTTRVLAPIVVTADREQYFPGELALISVRLVEPAPRGATAYLYVARERDAGEAETIWEFEQPIDGLELTFGAPIEMPRTHFAGVVINGANGEPLAAGDVDLGVGAGLDSVPPEIRTYELFDLDIERLREDMLRAAANGDVLDVALGSRAFTLSLTNNIEIVEGVDLTGFGEIVLLAGSVAGASGSTVAITFVDRQVHMWIDPDGPVSDSDALFIVEPTALHDPSRPSGECIAYLARDVEVPPIDFDEPAPLRDPTGGRRPSAPGGDAPLPGDAGPVGTGDDPAPRTAYRILLNLFSDTGFGAATNRVFHHVNVCDAVFRQRLGTRVFGVMMNLINTNAYPDVHAGFLNQFQTDYWYFGFNEMLDVLYTNNPANIAYGSRLGEAQWTRAQWAGDANAYGWVRNAGSDYVCLLTGLHEISHLLGASNSSTGHSSEVLRTHCRKRVFGVCVKRHYIYSVMRATLDPSRVVPEWRQTDRQALLNVIHNTPGHFRF